MIKLSIKLKSNKKMKYLYQSRFFLFALIILFTSSCKDIFNTDDDPKPQDKYLVNYKLETSYLPSFIKIGINEYVDEYPELEMLLDKVEHGVMIYSIDYNTTFKGQNVIASGLVCIPIGEGPFPVMSYQNGTNTLHSNAPSANPSRDLYLMLEFAASTGFIIAIPDYLGFGRSSNMFHPYLHKESTVQSIIDMLRAIDELNTNYLDVVSSGELFITGYSQGGWSTMQLQKEIEENYSTEFNLVASSCAAGPYDLNFVNQYITSQTEFPMPYYVGYMYNSYFNLELITTPVEEIFQEPYAAKISTLYDGTKDSEQINAELTTTMADLFTADYLANYQTDEKYASLINSLTSNSIEAWNTSIPTLLIHGTADEFVPFQVSYDIHQDFLSLGVDQEQVLLLPLEGIDHTTSIIPAGLASIEWFLQIKN
jgi:pimeloyl-ACP methyl ester carboxylesterase